jgi:hypothetical protein
MRLAPRYPSLQRESSASPQELGQRRRLIHQSPRWNRRLPSK